MRQRHVAPQLGLVEELPEAQAGRLHQPTEIRQGADRGEVLQVAPTFIGCVEQLLSAAGLPQPELLTTGHRTKGEIAGAASERFGNLAHQEQVR